MDDAEGAVLARLVRDEGRRVLATLVRTAGSLQLAEDAVQDAVVRALEVWPTTGIPEQPRAWLTLTARRRAIDLIRREAGRDVKESEASRLASLSAPEQASDSQVRDDQLRLVFTCCHPSLTVEAQVALALRTLCGLTTAQVARALLVSEDTMTRRLTRAKDKIARAAIPYRVPNDAELPDRLSAVASVVYLVFTEGHSATDGNALLRADVVDEAVRLGRLLVELLPHEPSALGLLALMLLTDARRSTRTDEAGDPVLLADQDRSRWDRHQVVEGVELVGRGLLASPDRADRYVVQAAIAACHCLAPTYAETDWAAVVSWYDVLISIADSPTVRLNRAAAIAERDGPAVGLAEMDAVVGLETYALWHAARGELLTRLGRREEAAIALRTSLALPMSAPQGRFVKRRLDGLS